MRKLLIGSVLCAILVLAGVAYAAVSAVTERNGRSAQRAALAANDSYTVPPISRTQPRL